MGAMVYSWRPGVSPAVPAQVAGEEMERIRVHNNGRLTQEDIVEAAKPKTAPLHPAFEWNDKKAAEQWRLEQASYMIRHIAVAVSGSADRAPIRAFVNVTRDEDRSYTSIAHAMSDGELRHQVIAAAWKELEDWRKRHTELVEFARLFTVIEELRPAKVA